MLGFWTSFAWAQAATSGPLEIGSASGQPGEIVAVPVFASFEHPLLIFVAVLEFDGARLEFLRYYVEGSDAEGANPGGVAFGTFPPSDHALIGILDPGETQALAFRVPAGERRMLGRIEFRVRAIAEPGDAAIRPVTGIPETAGTTSYALIVGEELVESAPSDLITGTVSVRSPLGPRPVGDLSCAQLLDRVTLRFAPSETYDSIQISRDGEALASLPGSATSYTDPIERLGRLRYEVTARRGAETSLAVSCEVQAVSPAAPAVEDLTCGQSGLAWRNPVAYDRIIVLKDGEAHAELAGSAQSYVDPERSERLTLYSVLGELEGYRGPEANCLDNGVWILEVGDVQAPLDAETIIVPIFVTTSAALQGFSVCLDFDESRFQFVLDLRGALAGTVGHPSPELFAMGPIGACGHPVAAVVYDYNPPREEEKDLPVGLRQHIFNVTLRPVGPFAPGETFLVSLVRGRIGGTTLTVRGGQTVQGVISISGQIRLGSTGVAPVEDLDGGVAGEGEGGGAGMAGAGDVVLSWRNASAYDALRIERNGVALAEIAGSEESFVDAAVPRGIYTYKVTGVAGGQTSFPASKLLSTFTPPGTFLRGDSNRDGRINISDPIATLSFLFLDGAALPCEDAADADDDGRLLTMDAIVTLHYLFLGTAVLRAPGTLYPWFDPTHDQLSCRE